LTSEELTPARINLIRWAHWRHDHVVKRVSLKEMTEDLQGAGVNVAYWQIRNAYHEPRVFMRLCDGTPGFLRAIYQLYGKPKDLQ
jgi:hypothetical protein